MTSCQLCIAPHYLLPYSFGLPCSLGEEGDVEDHGAAELPGLPWQFNSTTGELVYFLANLKGEIASAAYFTADAKVFEECFGRDVRFLHHHNHNHDCAGTCVKNMMRKTKEQLAGLVKSNRAPPCRFLFYPIVQFCIEEKLKNIRRRGMEIFDTPHLWKSIRLARPFTTATLRICF